VDEDVHILALAADKRPLPLMPQMRTGPRQLDMLVRAFAALAPRLPPEQAVRDAFKNIPSETLGRGLMRTTEELRELLTNAWRVE